jgi:nucleotide-binding universal stress UspA family protein
MTIICGTDFSVSAAAACDVAAAIARKLGDRLLLVHAIEDEDYAERNVAHANEFQVQRGEQLAREAKRLAASGTLVRETLEAGRADVVLARLCHEHQTRMVIVGAIGVHGGEPGRVGSVAECIAGTASVPVLVIRDGSQLFSWACDASPLNVLVAYDFTASSEAALAWTGELRVIGPCDIVVAYVGPANASAEKGGPHSDIEERLHRRVDQILGKERTRLCIRITDEGAAPVLTALSTEAGSDLIVSGTHHYGPWHQLLHGSVSQEVLRHTTTSVACIPSESTPTGAATARTPERILVATDFSAQGNRAVAQACALAPAGGTVKVVYVATHGNSEEPGALRRLRATIPMNAERRGIHPITQVLEGERVAEAIRLEAEQFDADLICVGTKDRSALSRASTGSVARTLVSHSKRPLLIIHPPPP